MNKKKYKIDHAWLSWDCEIEIDHDHENTTNAIKAMVEFWTDWEMHLDNNEGDYTKAFLQQLASEICIIGVRDNYNLNGIIKSFNDREGWTPMDGTSGITIISADTYSFDFDDFDITEHE